MCQQMMSDLDFLETDKCEGSQISGGIYRGRTWDWSAAFALDFDATDFGFSKGYTQLYGFALGPIEQSNTLASSSSRWAALLGS
jgi:hypothetical protein